MITKLTVSPFYVAIFMSYPCHSVDIFFNIEGSVKSYRKGWHSNGPKQPFIISSNLKNTEFVLSSVWK